MLCHCMLPYQAENLNKFLLVLNIFWAPLIPGLGKIFQEGKNILFAYT